VSQLALRLQHLARQGILPRLRFTDEGEGGETNAFVLVQNFFEELKQRVGN